MQRYQAKAIVVAQVAARIFIPGTGDSHQRPILIGVFIGRGDIGVLCRDKQMRRRAREAEDRNTSVAWRDFHSLAVEAGLLDGGGGRQTGSPMDCVGQKLHERGLFEVADVTERRIKRFAAVLADVGPGERVPILPLGIAPIRNRCELSWRAGEPHTTSPCWSWSRHRPTSRWGDLAAPFDSHGDFGHRAVAVMVRVVPTPHIGIKRRPIGQSFGSRLLASNERDARPCGCRSSVSRPLQTS